MRFSPSETLNDAPVVKACVDAVTDDYMVEDFAIYKFCGFREVFREFYILFRRFRIAGWVIMPRRVSATSLSLTISAVNSSSSSVVMMFLLSPPSGGTLRCASTLV